RDLYTLSLHDALPIFALAAIGTVTVEHDRRVLALVNQSIDLGHVRDVQRHRDTGFGGHVDGAGNVTDRILAERSRVEHEGGLRGDRKSTRLNSSHVAI